VLVRRHGPMVLRVCRGIVHDLHAAEDAFQAAFLVLARKAASIRKGQSVGSWLYKVAYRVAVQARADAARRSARDSQAPSRSAAAPADEVAYRELQTVFNEELQQLPEKYQLPVLLCCLDGQTRDEAAQQLGWSLGTLKRRLERGRNRLRARLARRGWSLPAVLGPLLLAREVAAVPDALVAAAVRTGLAGAAPRA